jgi:hypothetical protein
VQYGLDHKNIGNQNKNIIFLPWMFFISISFVDQLIGSVWHKQTLGYCSFFDQSQTLRLFISSLEDETQTREQKQIIKTNTY